MTEVSFAADKVYIVGPLPPRQLLVTRGVDGEFTLWGIRSHQPLGPVNWRTVYERRAAQDASLIAKVLGKRQLDVDFDHLTADGELLVFSPAVEKPGPHIRPAEPSWRSAVEPVFADRSAGNAKA